MTTTTMQYTNPRLHAVIDDWPYGRDLRTTATFAIEQHPTRGERGTRTTVDPTTGRTSKPKVLTYARQMRIVDGDDGLGTYIASLTLYRSICIFQSNMQLQQEYVGVDDPRYPALLALFA